MTLIPLSYLPGVCKVNSAYSDSMQQAANAGRPAAGRITDMDKVRFIAGMPEKIKGWEQTITNVLDGVPRGMRDWRDNDQIIYLAIGTNRRLYALSENQIPLNEITDITPLRELATGFLNDPFDTTSGDATVNVSHTDHGQETGDYVVLTATTAVGGLLIQGVFQITVLDADNYTIEASTTANATANGGDSTGYDYFRAQLTDPISTVSGSSTVTITQTNHGAMSGDIVIVDGASAVGGLTIDGEYEILSTSTNSYTINGGSAASGTATGGGSVSVQYLISVGFSNSATAFGYGTGGYGEEGYGETSGDSGGIILNARVWTLAKYGAQLLANPSGGTIYVWDPAVGGRALPLYGAPESVLAMFVTPERFVMALGCLDDSPSGIEGNAMQVRWPDQSNYNDWTSTPTNTANEGRTLQEGSFLVNGIAVRNGISLVFSNTSAYEFLYSGDNEIYDSNPSGDKNGLIGPLAVTVLGGVAYWLSGQGEFWHWNGSAMVLPSDDIRDFVFDDINREQDFKCVVASNVAKKEIWFFYCSADSTEIDRYVIFHIDQNCWSCGNLVRTSWIDRGLFQTPMACNSDGLLFNQESGNDDNGVAIDAHIEFSPIDISKGDRNMDVMGFVPDFKRQTGEVDLSILTQTYPQETATVEGPYTIEDDASTPRIDLRIGAKMIGFKLESNVLGGDFRLGMPKLELQPAGARR